MVRPLKYDSTDFSLAAGAVPFRRNFLDSYKSIGYRLLRRTAFHSFRQKLRRIKVPDKLEPAGSKGVRRK